MPHKDKDAKLLFSYAKRSKKVNPASSGKTTYTYSLKLDTSGKATEESLDKNVTKFMQDEQEETLNKNRVLILTAYQDCTAIVRDQFLTAVASRKPKLRPGDRPV